MGGNYWQYFVPYQQDIQQAFVALRQRVFAAGDYPVMPPPAAGMTFEQFCAYYGGVPLHQLSEAERREEEELFRLWSRPFEPTTIDALLEWNGSEGTGTILDVTTFYALDRLTDIELLATFGTLQPDRHLIEAAGAQILRARAGLCVYVVVYADGEPSEIFFVGLTGD